MNQPLFPPIDPARGPGGHQSLDSDRDLPPDRRFGSGWLLAGGVAILLVVAGAFLLTGCDAQPVEEVDVGEVTEDGQATELPEDKIVSLSGEVKEVLTESALTVTDEQSEEPLLVLLTPATIVNGTAVTLGGQPGGLAQLIPPEGTVRFVGTIDTFDSVALAERLGIVLNEELFAQWEGDPVLIAQQVDTLDAEAEPAAETDPVSG